MQSPAFSHLPFFVWSEQSLGVGAGAGAGSASTQPLFLPSHVQSPAFLHLPFFVCCSQVLFATHAPCSYLHCFFFVHFFSRVNSLQSMAAATMLAAAARARMIGRVNFMVGLRGRRQIVPRRRLTNDARWTSGSGSAGGSGRRSSRSRAGGAARGRAPAGRPAAEIRAPLIRALKRRALVRSSTLVQESREGAPGRTITTRWCVRVRGGRGVRGAGARVGRWHDSESCQKKATARPAPDKLQMPASPRPDSSTS